MLHVSILNKCFDYPSFILLIGSLRVKENLSYEEVLIAILDRRVHNLRTDEVASVKVLWRNHIVEEAMGEAEEDMKARYMILFSPSNENV